MKKRLAWVLPTAFLWASLGIAIQRTDETLAEELVREAEQLRSSGGPKRLDEARSKYEKAIALWREMGPTRGEALALVELGELLEQMGESGAAQKEYEGALLSSQSLDAPEIEAEAANLLSALHGRAGRNALALELGLRAEQAALRVGSDTLFADALFNQGYAQYSFGRMREAIRLFEESAAAAGRTAATSAKARALLDLGFAALAINSNESARGAFEEALLLQQQSADPSIQADALRGMGQLHKRLGEMQKALDYYEQARALLTDGGDPSARATLSNAMGQVYFDMGEPETALRYYEEALSLSRSAGFRMSEAGSLSETARCYSELGNEDEALNRFRQAAAIHRELDDPRLEADILGEMGRLHDRAGDHVAALGLFDDAIALKTASDDTREKAYLLNDGGTTHRKLRNYETAVPLFTEALALSRSAEDPIGESLALYNLALVHREMGLLAKSYEEVENSLRIVERLRSDVASRDLRTSLFATVQSRYFFYMDLLLQMHREGESRGLDKAAFAVSERARARTLLESLTEAAAGAYLSARPELREREGSLKAQLNEAARKQELFSGDAASGKRLSDEIRELTLEYDRLRARILSSNPRYAALTQPVATTVDEVQARLLDSDTRLLAYVLGEQKTLLFSVTRDRYAVHELPPAEELEERTRDAYHLLTTRQQLGASSPKEARDRTRHADRELGTLLQDLSDTLLGPIEGLGATKRLAIVADGALSYLPFAALPLPRRKGGEGGEAGAPLVATFEIVRLPSASTLSMLRQQERPREFAKSLVIAADPVYELDDPRVLRERQEASAPTGPGNARATEEGLRISRLLFSRREAKDIVSLLPEGQGVAVMDFEANREWAQSADFRGVRVLHFAAHGIIDNKYPDLSGVVLSLLDETGTPRDGFLRLHDIYNLILPVDLVVLSACETALGKEVKGEGLLGLVRGFMYAGAPRVVASLWKVDDEATGELMLHFYQNLFVRHLTPSASLRAAQVSMWRTRSWSAPFFWAGFELQGEWN